MADPIYTLPDQPVYSEAIRKLQDNDPASASTVFNPLIEALLGNIHFLKQLTNTLQTGKADLDPATGLLKPELLPLRVIAARDRAPDLPDYGLGGGGDEAAVILEAGPYSGTAEISILVGGTEYDAANLSADGENAPDGTIIITKLEE